MDIAGLRVPIDARPAEEGSRRVQAALNQMTPAARRAMAGVKSSISGLKADLLSLGSVAAGITFVALTRSLTQAAIKLDNISDLFTVVTGNSRLARAELNFLAQTADKMGIKIDDVAEAYGRFLQATKGTSLEGKASREIFEGITSAMVALQAEGPEVANVLEAIQRQISRGTFDAETFAATLGRRFPGAMRLAAESMNMPVDKFRELADKGEIVTEDLLPKLGKKLKETFGAAAAREGDRLEGLFNRISNQLLVLKGIAVDSGFLTAMEKGLKKVLEALKSPGAIEAAAMLGQVLGKAVELAANAFAFLAEHANAAFVILAAYATLRTAAVLRNVALAAGSVAVEMAALAGSKTALVAQRFASMTGASAALGVRLSALPGLVSSAAVGLGRLAAANPWIALAAAIAAAIALIVQFDDELITFRGHSFTLRDAFEVIWEDIRFAGEQAWSAIVEYATSAWDTIVQVGGAAVDVFLGTFFPGIQEAWGKLTSWMSETFRGFVQNIVDYYKPLVDFFSNSLDTLASRAAQLHQEKERLNKAGAEGPPQINRPRIAIPRPKKKVKEAKEDPFERTIQELEAKVRATERLIEATGRGAEAVRLANAQSEYELILARLGKDAKGKDLELLRNKIFRLSELEERLRKVNELEQKANQLMEEFEDPAAKFNKRMKELGEILKTHPELWRAAQNAGQAALEEYEQAQDAVLRKARDWESGMKRALKDIHSIATDTASNLEAVFKNAFQGLEDAILDFVTEGKNSFGDFFKSVFKDFSRLFLREGMGRLLGSIFPELNKHGQPGLVQGGPGQGGIGSSGGIGGVIGKVFGGLFGLGGKGVPTGTRQNPLFVTFAAAEGGTLSGLFGGGGGGTGFNLFANSGLGGPGVPGAGAPNPFANGGLGGPGTSNIFDPVVTAGVDAANKTGAAFGQAAKTTEGGFSGMINSIGGFFKDIFGSIFGGLFGGGKAGGGALGGIFSKLGGAFKSVFSSIGGFFGGLFGQGGVMMGAQGLLMGRAERGLGGITGRPRMTIFGEGDGPEAFVPLRGGAIPLMMRRGQLHVALPSGQLIPARMLAQGGIAGSISPAARTTSQPPQRPVTVEYTQNIYPRDYPEFRRHSRQAAADGFQSAEEQASRKFGER